MDGHFIVSKPCIGSVCVTVCVCVSVCVCVCVCYQICFEKYVYSDVPCVLFIEGRVRYLGQSHF